MKDPTNNILTRSNWSHKKQKTHKVLLSDSFDMLRLISDYLTNKGVWYLKSVCKEAKCIIEDYIELSSVMRRTFETKQTSNNGKYSKTDITIKSSSTKHTFLKYASIAPPAVLLKHHIDIEVGPCGMEIGSFCLRGEVKLKNGAQSWYMPSSDGRRRYEYICDVRNGISKTWERGHLLESSNYLNGAFHGPQLRISHRFVYTAEYQKGKRVNINRQWYRESNKEGSLRVQLYRSKKYDDDGKLISAISYHPNGNVYKIINFKDDLKEGSYTECYPDGLLFTKGFYHRDCEHGWWYVYGPNLGLLLKTWYHYGDPTSKEVPDEKMLSFWIKHLKEQDDLSYE